MKIGSKVKDKITGLTGVVVQRKEKINHRFECEVEIDGGRGVICLNEKDLEYIDSDKQLSLV